MLGKPGHLPVPRATGQTGYCVWLGTHPQSSDKQIKRIESPADVSDEGETLLAGVQYGYTNKLP